VKHRGSILVIEDDSGVREQLAAAFKIDNYEVELCASGREGYDRLDAGETAFDLVVTDLRLPDVSGMEIVDRVIATRPDCPVLVMTAYASVDSAVDAMRRGAFHYLAKPITADSLLVEVGRAMEHGRLRKERRLLRARLSAEQGLGRILGESQAIAAMRESISAVAAAQTTVLVSGETGTGKELVANAIHYEGARAAGELVKVNCAALSESLLESELFGHEKGAFTGAESARAGRFERADGGTLFLDEISEMGPHVQAKLLRVLQGEVFERVGGDKPLNPDVRVISATNRKPLEAVECGKLRSDLYYRLNAFPIEVPPLRSRREDIPLLARHFTEAYAAKMNKPVSAIAEDAIGALCAHDWPGNVRELENCIERAVIVAREESLQKIDLPVPISGLAGATPTAGLNLQELERETVLRALHVTGGNKVQAAAMLGIYPSSLYKKLRRFGISKDSHQRLRG